MLKDAEDTGGAPPRAGEMSEAEIDDNLEDTFPASDPPSWTLGTNHREQSPDEESSPEAADGEKRDRS